jgi:hypothetical protein
VNAPHYVVVFGRGLEQSPQGTWDMSTGTEGRIEAAVEFARTEQVAAFILLGGHSKHLDPPPPKGVKEIGFMGDYVQSRLPEAQILDDDDWPSGDTVDGVINFATLADRHSMWPRDGVVFHIPSGNNHYPRIAKLSRLAMGLNEEEAAQAFYQLPVLGEDSMRGALKEGVGALALDMLTAGIVPDAPTNDRFAALRAARDTMDDWLAHKMSVRTWRGIAAAAGPRLVSLMGSTPATPLP